MNNSVIILVITDLKGKLSKGSVLYRVTLEETINIRLRIKVMIAIIESIIPFLILTAMFQFPSI